MGNHRQLATAADPDASPSFNWRAVDFGGYVEDKGRTDMVKFLQICASQDDLFALDAEGDVYQYNFKMKMWIQLVASRDSMTAIDDFEGEGGARRKRAVFDGAVGRAS